MHDVLLLFWTVLQDKLFQDVPWPNLTGNKPNTVTMEIQVYIDTAPDRRMHARERLGFGNADTLAFLMGFSTTERLKTTKKWLDIQW